ncbi:E3 ubiquitin-protein ligase Midline-1-like [Rana temporaria]|uniref:E3 ubiquitin-protein ligase Midline-1-like n=1 Tax=Rana temporaria TaxID=8407 RepID=UPI001AAD003F|nr:E3 ubiquitin-protein ligase Midline-1-like [Rana temporaria]
MASADVKVELQCPVCLNISTNPVTLRCGHNFCRVCIDRVLDTQEGSGGYSCPECREKFPDRPALQKKIKPCTIAETFLSAQPDQESRVFCTYCVDSPVPAVRSCLHCEVSLCDKHLRVHKKSPVHILCDPTLSMESRKCSVHKKILEYYCTEDKTCICVSCCLIGGHKGHKMKSLDEASEKKKETLRNVLQKHLTKREETEERVQSLQEHRRKVEEEAAGDTERVTVLFKDLRRRLKYLEKRVLRGISGQAQRISICLLDFIRDLEIKKEELSRKVRHIEELCNMTDLCDTEDGDNEDRERHEKLLHDGGGLGVAGVLHTGLSDIITEVNVYFSIQGDADILMDVNTAGNDIQISDDRNTASRSDIDQNHPETPEISQDCPQVMSSQSSSSESHYRDVGGSESWRVGMCCPADILLDVNTAHKNLQISDDRKTVSRSYRTQKRPETPERFQYCPQVMSSQSFSSGRHYWDVEVGGSDEWIVGMCYPSIDMKGKSEIGKNKKSWGLDRSGDHYYVMNASKVIPLAANFSSNRVRIDLDYEAGRISFYDLCDPIQDLYTFTTTFTEPLHAVFNVMKGCIKICGGRSENSAQSPVTSQEWVMELDH